MKLIIILIICSFSIISSEFSAANISTKETLSVKFRMLENYLNSVEQDNPFYNAILEAKSKLFCIKNQLNFEKNKDKELNEPESLILFVGAGVKCLSNQDNIWRNIVNTIYYTSKNQFDIEYTECLQMEYKKLEPNSRLLRDFKIDNMTKAVSMCEQVQEIKMIEDSINEQSEQFVELSELTCGLIDNRVLMKFVLNLELLEIEHDENEVEMELSRLQKYLKQLATDVFDCARNRVDSRIA